VTSQGHPRTVFRRALERGNLMLAEVTAREVGSIDLREALELTALMARADPARGERAALRWLRRWLDETPEVTLGSTTLVVGCLGELGSARHGAALRALRECC
jgi:hypothetical protein